MHANYQDQIERAQKYFLLAIVYLRHSTAINYFLVFAVLHPSLDYDQLSLFLYQNVTNVLTWQGDHLSKTKCMQAYKSVIAYTVWFLFQESWFIKHVISKCSFLNKCNLDISKCFLSKSVGRELLDFTTVLREITLMNSLIFSSLLFPPL